MGGLIRCDYNSILKAAIPSPITPATRAVPPMRALRFAT